MALIIGFAMTACSNGGDDKEDFVAVTDITGAPTAATVGTALTLTGTVEPSTATNKTITWSLVSGSATVSGNTLNPTGAGQVTVKATIANGKAQGKDFTKDFTITVTAVSTGGGNNDDDDDFVAVTDITGVPTAATVGTALTLTGTVEPSTATNKTITWSVTNGTGTAAVSGDTLTASAAGQVTVKATIANGTAQGTDYTKDFTITVTAESTGGGNEFTANSLEELKTWLNSKPANNKDSPFVIRLTGDNTSLYDIGEVLSDDTKYVILDLSGSTIDEIGDYGFADCISLIGITIPNRVTSIWSNTFAGCTNLTSVTIPDSITEIGFAAFYECTSLTSVTIPDSVTSIERFAFYGCTSLASVTIPDSVISIEYRAFEGCTSLESVTIGNGVTSIERRTFADCENLTSVTIGNGVTSIGEQAFADCENLASITIPGSVTSIGDEAFDGCYELTSVTFAAGSNIPSDDFGNNAFPQGYNAYGGNSLKTAYSTEKAGRYTRTANGPTWTKQP